MLPVPQARTGLSRLAMIAATVLLAAPLSTAHAQQSPTLTPELSAARAGLERYRDPVMAVHDGYLSTLGCVEYRQGLTEGAMQYVAGGMGVHFLNPQLIGPTLDPARPQVLIYEPVGDSLRLVAAEWFVPVPVAGEQRPAIFGHELEGPMEGHAPIMPEGLHHYDLHVWLWKDNPAGVFSPTNPAVRCQARGYSFNMQAPKMVGHQH